MKKLIFSLIILALVLPISVGATSVPISKTKYRQSVLKTKAKYRKMYYVCRNIQIKSNISRSVLTCRLVK